MISVFSVTVSDMYTTFFGFSMRESETTVSVVETGYTIFSGLQIHAMNEFRLFLGRWSLRKTVLRSRFLRPIILYS